jgi:sugar porter (SP) family MFS transporter
MNLRILLWSIISALAGFLFGFDTVVISGAEQTIQSLWGLSTRLHGVAMAAALYGTIAGALLGCRPADRFGRKVTLLVIGVFYLVAAVWSALATNVYSFILARVIGGLAIGISTVATPLYISEIAPASHRGLLGGLFQFNIVFGILVAYLSNSLLADVGPNAWRWMLGVVAFPSAAYMLLCLGIPESPRWLLGRGDRQGGMKVLRLIEASATPDQIKARADEIAAASMESASTARFWTWNLRMPILLAILIAVFNQLSGINAVLYFAPRIFRLAGLGEKAALLQSVGIGVTMLVFTFVGMGLVDRLGRRALLIIGSIGYIVSLSLVAWAFFTEHLAIVPVCIFVFVAAHNIGQGAVIWVFLSEIFPNRHRAEGTALGCSTHWLFAALITTLFPTVVSAFAPGYIFAFFAFVMVLQLIWVTVMVPETKGVPLEQIEKQLAIGSSFNSL